MLQADFAAAIQERLEILVVVVEMVLISQELLDDLCVFNSGFFHLLHVRETTQAAGYVTRKQRLPFEHSHDSNRVNQSWLSSLWLRRDPHEIELFCPQPEGVRSQTAGRIHSPLQLGRNRQPIRLAFGDDKE